MWPETDHFNYNCVVTNEQGQTRKVYANWLHNNHLDSWKDWRCNAGHTRFYIDKHFDIYSGECRNDLLGNILQDWQIKTDSVCHQTTCTGCTDDLITKKFLPNDRQQ